MESAGESLPGRLLYSGSAISRTVRKLAGEISARLIDTTPTFLILLKGAARFAEDFRQRRQKTVPVCFAITGRLRIIVHGLQ
ncbi:MAG: hypothetical protein FVQ81_01100 [Candidatus Glassbacteria bacterium]|nr:hypothetical protein [Candidatus Glassbacteria bacterium]